MLCCPGTKPPPHAGCGTVGNQAEASQQWQCQTYAVPSHRASLCSCPAQHVPMGMVLPSAEMLLQLSLIQVLVRPVPSGKGLSWAQLPCSALHPPTPLAAAAQHSSAGVLGQPNPHMCGVSESTLPGPRRLCSGWISHHSCRAMVLAHWRVSAGRAGDLGWQCNIVGAGAPSEFLIGSILAHSFAMQATSQQCLWGPVREGAPSFSNLTNLTHPSLLPLRLRPSGYGSVGR